jgi:hypothetical protein
MISFISFNQFLNSMFFVINSDTIALLCQKLWMGCKRYGQCGRASHQKPNAKFWSRLKYTLCWSISSYFTFFSLFFWMLAQKLFYNYWLYVCNLLKLGMGTHPSGLSLVAIPDVFFKFFFIMTLCWSIVYTNSYFFKLIQSLIFRFKYW